MPHGTLNCAAAPVPSVLPAVVDPASVVVTPDATMALRTACDSVMRIAAPLSQRATYPGLLNDAPAPVPSADAAVPDPAKVTTD